jgi:VPDSG-CTERM motif
LPPLRRAEWALAKIFFPSQNGDFQPNDQTDGIIVAYIQLKTPYSMKIARLSTLFSALLLLAGGITPAHAITVVNGDFETSPFLIPPIGWSAPNGTLDMVYIPGQTGTGLEIGGIGGAVNNSIDQVVSGFTIGNTYTINFALASQWAGGSGAQAELSFLSGSLTPSAIFTAPPVPGFGLWANFSYNFVASATSIDIQFLEITNGFDDVGIDNITIAATPDGGSTVALLGIALCGLVGLRRKLVIS